MKVLLTPLIRLDGTRPARHYRAMKKAHLVSTACLGFLALAACRQEPLRPENPPPPPAPSQPVTLIGEERALLEWRGADNRESCAPLALASDGGKGGSVRAADFAGGWAIAFDLPGTRSAYGVAGVGLLNIDNDSIAQKRQELQKQWPYFREIAGLPAPAFAGYGLQGAKPYPAANPDGTGLDSLAYLRVGGQKCMYNVWSKLGRAHLEHLLDNLRVVERR